MLLFPVLLSSGRKEEKTKQNAGSQGKRKVNNMSDDYGYFGSGSEGYAHYVAATGEDEYRGGGGKRPKGKQPGGCFWVLVVIVVLAGLSLLLD